MQLVKDNGTSVQVEITRSDWIAISDAIEVQLDALEHNSDQATAKRWIEPLAAFLNAVPNDFLIRKESDK